MPAPALPLMLSCLFQVLHVDEGVKAGEVVVDW